MLLQKENQNTIFGICKLIQDVSKKCLFRNQRESQEQCTSVHPGLNKPASFKTTESTKIVRELTNIRSKTKFISLTDGETSNYSINTKELRQYITWLYGNRELNHVDEDTHFVKRDQVRNALYKLKKRKKSMLVRLVQDSYSTSNFQISRFITSNVYRE